MELQIRRPTREFLLTKHRGQLCLRFWRTFSLVALVFLILVERVVKVIGYRFLIANQLHSYLESVFLTRNGIFQQNSIPWENDRIVLEGKALKRTPINISAT
ncbi:hypothetical protein TNCV_4080611 [Trichonephila clavipes]|nr:hypothetical protein TNCV_4080611 [Trichonephila clavipes]